MLWLGLHARFFTLRFASSCQEILQEMHPNVMREAAAPGVAGSHAGEHPQISVERVASR